MTRDSEKRTTVHQTHHQGGRSHLAYLPQKPLSSDVTQARCFLGFTTSLCLKEMTHLGLTFEQVFHTGIKVFFTLKFPPLEKIG